MNINPSAFLKYNVTDTCSVWNVLSSLLLFYRSKTAGVSYVCSGYVMYECLIKTRSVITEVDEKLQARLRDAQGQQKEFITFQLTIEDLQNIEVLEKRNRLGKGELSSIILARKMRLAFLTDDQKARSLGQDILPREMTQTTPHLLSWLFFNNYLSDVEISTVKEQHEEMMRPLGKYFDEAYREACRCRSMSN